MLAKLIPKGRHMTTTPERPVKWKIGDSVVVSKTITDDDIRAYAALSGDYNPVHVDDRFARTTQFGRRIAHGMLTASLISNAIGNQLPGRGALYLGQTLRFTAPVYPGDTIAAKVTITKIREDKPIMTLETVCSNQRGETVIEGEATVKVMPV